MDDNDSYRNAFPSRHFKASDTGGRRLLATIDYVEFEVVGISGAQERKLVCHFREKNLKPLVLNLVNSTTIAEIAKTESYKQWGGTKVVIYATTVEFKGKNTPCTRLAAPKEKMPVQTPPPSPAATKAVAQPVVADPVEMNDEAPDFGLDEVADEEEPVI